MADNAPPERVGNVIEVRVLETLISVFVVVQLCRRGRRKCLNHAQTKNANWWLGIDPALNRFDV